MGIRGMELGQRGRRFGGVRRALVGMMMLALAGVIQVPAQPAFAVPAIVPLDFEYSLVTNVSAPMDVAWTPDGRMLIPTKGGQLRVFENGMLNSAPALDLSAVMCTSGERGMLAGEPHPDFAQNRQIFVSYVFNKFGTCNESVVDGPVIRLSRFELPPSNVIDPATEVVYFDTSSMHKDHHTGGDIKVANDGYLYMTVGDSGALSLGYPQDTGVLLGKIVRLTLDGGIPSDNPFTGSGTARCNVDGVPPAGSPVGTTCQEIYSLGLRNPFRFAFDPNTSATRAYINDVGRGTWEEVDELGAGFNYGWSDREGPCETGSTTFCGPSGPQFTDPVHWYGQGPDGAAITGGAFVPNGIGWPNEGKYVFSDYIFGEIYQLDTDGTLCLTCSPPTSAFNQVLFATAPRVIAMAFSPFDDCLYFVSHDDSEIAKICRPGDDVGLVDPTTGVWYLRDAGTGAVTTFFYGNPGDIPFMGDWDCDGVATPGLFRQSDAFAYLRNSNTQGIADIRFFFGNPSDVPIAGDFNGDGCDTLSLYRPSEQRFYIINELGENEGGLGAAEFSFLFGNPGDKPVVGDWDGDSIDEIGLHRESTGFFYFRNTLTTGIADGEFFFGDPGDRFVAGDWSIVDGIDTPAVFRPSNTTFFFRHTLTQGIADSQFVFGEGPWLPVAGEFGLG